MGKWRNFLFLAVAQWVATIIVLSLVVWIDGGKDWVATAEKYFWQVTTPIITIITIVWFFTLKEE